MNEPKQNDVVRQFCERMDAEDVLRKQAATVEAIAAKLGVPVWHVYKVVLSSVSEQISTSHCGPKRREALGCLVAYCIDYAKACVAGGEFGAVWKRRRQGYIGEAAKDYCEM